MPSSPNHQLTEFVNEARARSFSSPPTNPAAEHLRRRLCPRTVRRGRSSRLQEGEAVVGEQLRLKTNDTSQSSSERFSAASRSPGLGASPPRVRNPLGRLALRAGSHDIPDQPEA